MVKQKIPRAAAKDELVRLNGVLQKPYILIGGLAVQQYVLTRNSVDIDLVCDFDTVTDVLTKLYPKKDWNIQDLNDDDYRPTYVITHRYKPFGDILFGPKVVERGGYSHLDWDELTEDAKPFNHKLQQLERILVPPPHALAYTKFISFIGREEKQEKKLLQDLKDFADLTNCDEFSIFKFWDLVRKYDDTGAIREQFRARSIRFPKALDDCCLLSIGEMFMPTSPVAVTSPGKTKSNITVYLAGPHANIERNRSVADALRANGLTVKVPYDEVASANLSNTSTDARDIRHVCISAISASDVLAVDLDCYGLDTAWEIGYGEGLGKRIIGFNIQHDLASSPRPINRRTYHENFMHGWMDFPVFEGLASTSEIAKQYQGQQIYVCGSFSNRAIDQLVRTRLNSDCRLLVPKQLVKAKASLPKNYPLTEREATNKLLAGADAILVVLPRYGMDAAWQIGYASALKKPIFGLVLRDDKKDVEAQSFWEHWMHGWKTKTHLPSLPDLISFLRGISSH
ncbi:MAG: nucleoside 2-deoxyribosyltransferase [Candidatus Contendobacter sp.]|nr:nucleoside 2-deoxyribosyltransferase [Candidatus Contendobacter sp.]